MQGQPLRPVVAAADLADRNPCPQGGVVPTQVARRDRAARRVRRDGGGPDLDPRPRRAGCGAQELPAEGVAPELIEHMRPAGRRTDDGRWRAVLGRRGRVEIGGLSTHLARFVSAGPPMHQYAPENARKHPNQTFAKHVGAGRGPGRRRFKSRARSGREARHPSGSIERRHRGLPAAPRRCLEARNRQRINVLTCGHPHAPWAPGALIKGITRVTAADRWAISVRSIR